MQTTTILLWDPSHRNGERSRFTQCAGNGTGIALNDSAAQVTLSRADASKKAAVNLLPQKSAAGVWAGLGQGRPRAFVLTGCVLLQENRIQAFLVATFSPGVQQGLPALIRLRPCPPSRLASRVGGTNRESLTKDPSILHTVTS